MLSPSIKTCLFIVVAISQFMYGGRFLLLQALYKVNDAVDFAMIKGWN